MIFGNFGDMIKQAKELQGNLKKIKEELSRARYQVEVQGVKVVVSGEMEVLEIKIGPNANLQKIDSIIKEAVNKALKAAKDEAAGKLSSAAGGLSIPGITS